MTTKMNFAAFACPLPLSQYTRRYGSLCLNRHKLAKTAQTRIVTKARVVTSRVSGNSAASNGNGQTSRIPIQVVACDMDGTMLNSAVSISQRNIATTKRLMNETDIIFVPATGKSRSGAVRAMAALGDYLKEKYPAGCPGVFLQGLIVFGTDGNVVYENKCDPELASVVVDIARELDLSLIAYSRDTILCEKMDEFVELLPSCHEPAAEVVKNWEQVVGHRPLNKFIYMADSSRIDEIRPLVEERIGKKGHLTQALGYMLEVLPPDASKGYGVSQFLKSLAVEPKNVLAIGDAENDLEMLELAGYSCAVANALPSVKAVSKYTDISSNDEDGVAEAIERFVLAQVDVKHVEPSAAKA